MTEPDFQQKKSGSAVLGQKGGQNGVFVIFLKNGSNDFVHIVHINGWDDYVAFCKKPHVKEKSGSRVMAQNVSTNQMAGIPHVTMVEIGPQNMKWPNKKCTKWK